MYSFAIFVGYVQDWGENFTAISEQCEAIREGYAEVPEYKRGE